jgi:Txe/YoeB family toxin of Txe-Axe toxin-antitoxin module
MITCGGRQDKKTLRRINKLIEDAKRHPFDGLGKPEPLKATFPAIGHAGSTILIVWFMV